MMSNAEILTYTAIVYGVFITLLAIGVIQCHFNYVREDYARFICKNRKENGISIVDRNLLEELFKQMDFMRVVSHKTTVLKVVDDTFTTPSGITTHYKYHEIPWDGYKIKCEKNSFYVLLSAEVDKILEAHSQMALWLNDRGKKSIPVGNIFERLMSSLHECLLESLREDLRKELHEGEEKEEEKYDTHRVFQVWCKNQLVALGNIPLECLEESANSKEEKCSVTS